MTTARAQLHAQLTAVLQHPTDANFATEIQDILSGYRLQFKSKTAHASDQAQTARQALGASLQAMAADKSVDLLSRLAQILDEYRMQHKAAGKAKNDQKRLMITKNLSSQRWRQHKRLQALLQNRLCRQSRRPRPSVQKNQLLSLLSRAR